MTPFLICGLPRSRTAWLSKFLTYRDWSCGHDELRHCRQLEDVKSWLSQPYTGTVETAAAPFWRLALHLRSDLKVVTIRRDPEAAAESAIKAGFGSDLGAMIRTFRKLDHKLGQIERRVPGVRSFRFEDLGQESVCADLFEHCLPHKHHPVWWARWSAVNVQINVPALKRYAEAHGPQLERLRAIAEQKSRQLLTSRPVQTREGVTYQAERLDDVLRDGEALFRQHMADVGENPDAIWGKNFALMRRFEEADVLQVVTARMNGRLFGYLVTVISPTLESGQKTSAVHTTFYVSPDCPGAGLGMQRAAIELLRRRGVNEVAMRAGVRGAGERISALYRRLGAEPQGELYRLGLEGAA